jgi:putative intracellular protease/amidase
MTRVMMIASNVGLWAEELQAPWDALRKAGADLTLVTHQGRTPLPLAISMDPAMIDPKQNYLVNPPEVVARTTELIHSGEWDTAARIDSVSMNEYDAICVVGGPGAALDLTGNMFLHRLLLAAYTSGKPIAAICYAVGALVWTRLPATGPGLGRSLLYGRRVTAHPHAWDFDSDMNYELWEATADNPGASLVTPGFAYPLQPIVEDAVGPDGQVVADATANRKSPCVVVDGSLITALSVESSIAFGETLVKEFASIGASAR